MSRRRTDRVEDLVAWLLTCLGLLAVLGSVLVGHAAHGAALGRDGAPTPVRAVLALLWSAVCRVTAACNDAGWTREWARVEPRWRHMAQ